MVGAYDKTVMSKGVDKVTAEFERLLPVIKQGTGHSGTYAAAPARTNKSLYNDENPLGGTAARLKNVKTGETTALPVHGIFIAIGHAPSTELFKGKLAMKPNGYLITAPDSTATDIPGVFAAGDVTDETYRQAVTAIGRAHV